MPSVAHCFGLSYPTGQGANPIPGCDVDANNMAKIARMMGIPNVFVYTDKNKAITRKNILDALTSMVSGARPGDTLLFSYAGHGGQTKDTSGDEANGDGLDEFLVCADGMVLDDEIRVLLAQLPAGCRMVVVFDCCHSGTMVDLENNTQDIKAEVVALSAALDSQESMGFTTGGCFTAAILRVLQEKPGISWIDAVPLIDEYDNMRTQKPVLSSNMLEALKMPMFAPIGTFADASKGVQFASNVNPFASAEEQNQDAAAPAGDGEAENGEPETNGNSAGNPDESVDDAAAGPAGPGMPWGRIFAPWYGYPYLFPNPANMNHAYGGPAPDMCGGVNSWYPMRPRGFPGVEFGEGCWPSGYARSGAGWYPGDVPPPGPMWFRAAAPAAAKAAEAAEPAAAASAPAEAKDASGSAAPKDGARGSDPTYPEWWFYGARSAGHRSHAGQYYEEGDFQPHPPINYGGYTKADYPNGPDFVDPYARGGHWAAGSAPSFGDYHGYRGGHWAAGSAPSFGDYHGARGGHWAAGSAPSFGDYHGYRGGHWAAGSAPSFGDYHGARGGHWAAGSAPSFGDYHGYRSVSSDAPSCWHCGAPPTMPAAAPAAAPDAVETETEAPAPVAAAAGPVETEAKTEVASGSRSGRKKPGQKPGQTGWNNRMSMPVERESDDEDDLEYEGEWFGPRSAPVEAAATAAVTANVTAEAANMAAASSVLASISNFFSLHPV
ncbi:Ca(2+)-dependent cysteine protease [Blastocladiella emersonii ATCC 22665]|nr:Ca(2+)-dependent cysteine protease [Blastocladiella emersonii ATCC 22665]